MDEKTKKLRDELAELLHDEYRVCNLPLRAYNDEHIKEIFCISDDVIKQCDISSEYTQYEKILSTEDDFTKACVAVHDSWVIRNRHWVDKRNIKRFEETTDIHKQRVRRQVFLGIICWDKLQQ